MADQQKFPKHDFFSIFTCFNLSLLIDHAPPLTPTMQTDIFLLYARWTCSNKLHDDNISVGRIERCYYYIFFPPPESTALFLPITWTVWSVDRTSRPSINLFAVATARNQFSTDWRTNHDTVSQHYFFCLLACLPACVLSSLPPSLKALTTTKLYCYPTPLRIFFFVCYCDDDTISINFLIIYYS